MKKLISLSLVMLMLLSLVAAGCASDDEENAKDANTLYVYNWDEYIGEDVIEMFEEETGYKVVYDVFDTNESMYAKLASGDIVYDVICPSDYMIAKMAAHDMLQPINFDNIPNAKYIGDLYWEKSLSFDPGNLYSIPYTCGTLGIVYNPKMVDGEIDSWSVMFDEKYKGMILNQDSVRDAFAVALSYLGYSLNTLDLDELNEAKDLLCKQKALLQAYEIDYARERMINESAAMAVIYSGDAVYCRDYNEDLEFVTPKEGSNFFIDAWVIPKNAQNVKAAEAWLDFLNRPDIAALNLEYIYYSTPNTAVYDLVDEEIQQDEIVYMPESEMERCEAYCDLGDEGDMLLNDLWEDVKSY